MDVNLARIFKSARDEVIREWSKPAFEKMGSRLQRALLCERLFLIAAQQSDLVSAEAVRRLISEGWTWAIEQTEE